MSAIQLPATMQAAFITEYGPAESIHIGHIPLPAIGPTDVLVKVETLTVNPVDTFIRSGAYRTPLTFPFIVGRDVVGVVAARGEGVTRFNVGDRVWCNSLGHDGRQGSFAEFAVVPSERLYHLPPGIDPEEAVAVFHPAVTAWLGLFRHAPVRAGETVYVGGGAGNVGNAVIRMARYAGARVITSARLEDAEWCYKAGAEVVIDYHDEHLTEKIRDYAPDGVDIYWDTSGQHDLQGAVEVLGLGGRIIVMAGLSAVPDLPVGKLYTRNGSVVGFALSNATVSDLAEAAKMINQLLVEGRLASRIIARLSLEQTAEAHLLVEGKSKAGRLRGRVIIRPDPTYSV